MDHAAATMTTAPPAPPQKGTLMNPIRVGVNGYGVIGKRVADAILLQPDMRLIGVAGIATDWRIKSAANRLPVFASTAEVRQGMHDAGVTVRGSLDELLTQCDVIVDTTPKHVAAGNLERYRGAGVKAVLQGGESHATTGHSFVAQANYATALGRVDTRGLRGAVERRLVLGRVDGLHPRFHDV